MRFVWFLIVLLSGAWTCQAGAEERQAIRIATEGAFPPFNYIDQNGELQGFEVDLAKALCAVMEVTCTLVAHEWEGITKGLINRNYDAVMASLEMTERRRKRIAFSRRYYRMPASFIGPKDAPVPSVTPEALAGKRLATVERSDHAAYLASAYKQSDIRTYAKLDEANLDLLADRVDLVLGDKLDLLKFLQTPEGSCCRFVADVGEDRPSYGPGIGVGLRKEDEALKDLFDRAIAQVMADGTYDRIRAKYFPFDIR